ncbi:GntR family transcriptional regulator [Afifella sp. IM 167]|uniref:GntR family transcriptional regulator n=1 Tax=Afifella sp. IM 167 TaxID=2033586 RepID=UPI001CCD4D59|nr:GntR family transcriptional regulator [Afifella sp. IM 167]MBZ8135438.1 GntR family transcriptional regulator [Afifella sp. IM 167]
MDETSTDLRLLSRPGAAPVVAPKPLPQQVADYIRDLIIHDRLKPGERIRERRIAEELNVSRTPLRDALKILAMERLVDLTPNKGAVVVHSSDAEIADMLTVYTELESLGGRIACGVATEADILRVAHYDDVMGQAFAEEDRAGYFAANQGFHLSIVAASHNPTLIEMHSHLNIRLYRIRYLAVMSTQEWTAAAGEHRELLGALKARDADRLAYLQREHLGFAWRLIGAWSPPPKPGSVPNLQRPSRA